MKLKHNRLNNVITFIRLLLKLNKRFSSVGSKKDIQIFQGTYDRRRCGSSYSSRDARTHDPKSSTQYLGNIS